MKKMAFFIREARLPDDKLAIISFIGALLLFGHRLDSNHRTDPDAPEEYFTAITARMAERNGISLLAVDNAGSPIGWAIAHESDNDPYVVSEERIYGCIAELYVAEHARSHGIGRALIAACEDWARKRRLKTIWLGALSGNTHALEIYKRIGYEPTTTILKKYLA
jgi:GNAT superfamily N-acetyltransferase